MPKFNITSIDPVGTSGKVVKIVATDDQGVQGNYKGWVSDGWAVGEVEATTKEETKESNGRTYTDIFLKKPFNPSSGGRGGGGRAPDPERAKNDRERLNLEKEKQPLIMAQFVLGRAVDVAIARATVEGDFKLTTPNIQAIAIDLVAALEETHGEIARRFEIA